MAPKRKISPTVISIVLLVGLLILWELYSNAIISAYVNKGHLVMPLSDLKGLGKKPVYCGIDLLDYRNDFLETVSLSGWSFCESGNEGKEQERYVLLMSDDSSYMVRCLKAPRKDIYDAFTKSGYQISSEDLGYYAVFSTVGMKNGTYKLGLLVKEDSETSGVIRLGRSFIKNGSKIIPMHAGPLQLPGELQETNNGRFAIDNIALVEEENEVVISGWGCAWDYSSDYRKYVRITTKMGSNYYAAASRNRKDIARVYGEDYFLSGYTVRIPADQVPEGWIDVSLVLMADDRLCALPPISYSYKDGVFERREYSGKTIPGDTAKLRSGMDGYSYNASQLVISGWVIDQGGTQEGEVVNLRVSNGTDYMDLLPNQGRERPDIAEAFGEEHLNSGFYLSVPGAQVRERLGTKNLRVYVLLKKDEGIYTVGEPYELAWME